MNDNLTHEGPAHLFATNLLNDLMVLLGNAAKQGIERYDENGEPVYDFGYWAGECAKALNVQNFGP